MLKVFVTSVVTTVVIVDTLVVNNVAGGRLEA